MAIINQISTTNTFGQWVTTTQALIEHANFFSNTANLVLSTVEGANSVYSNTVNVYNSTVSANANAWNAYTNTQNINTSANNANANAWIAYTNAQNSSNNANTANTNAWASRTTITDDTTTDAVRYVLVTTQTTGNLTIANTSSTKLYYNCATGAAYATSFNNTSDVNLKENIKTIENALDVVSNLRGVTFTWKDNNQKSLGVIAQEVEEYLPELVVLENGVKSVTYGNFVGLLIEAIKELKERVVELENK